MAITRGMASAIKVIMPGKPRPKLSDRALKEHPAAEREDRRTEERRDPLRSGQERLVPAREAREHVAPEQRRDRQRERDPKLAPEHRHAVAGVLVVARVLVVAAMLPRRDGGVVSVSPRRPCRGGGPGMGVVLMMVVMLAVHPALTTLPFLSLRSGLDEGSSVELLEGDLQFLLGVITMGARQATGSPIGLPEMRRNRTGSAPAATVSPSPKRTRCPSPIGPCRLLPKLPSPPITYAKTVCPRGV
jgi:hypothetical protein